MENIAIFGCGAAGRGACRQLRSRFKIASFLDNDKAKHRSRLYGVTVRDPEKYDYSRVAHVFIASMYVDEILVQLLRLGVPASKIEYVSYDALKYRPQTVAGTLGRAACLSVLRRVLYMPFRILLWAGRKQCPA